MSMSFSEEDCLACMAHPAENRVKAIVIPVNREEIFIADRSLILYRR